MVDLDGFDAFMFESVNNNIKASVKSIGVGVRIFIRAKMSNLIFRK